MGIVIFFNSGFLMSGRNLPRVKICRRKFFSCPQLATQFSNWVPRSTFRFLLTKLRFVRGTNKKSPSQGFFICAPGRNRTCDHLLKRELLYRLSYGRNETTLKIYQKNPKSPLFYIELNPTGVKNDFKNRVIFKLGA